jgi:hypothetical protein
MAKTGLILQSCKVGVVALLDAESERVDPGGLSDAELNRRVPTRSGRVVIRVEKAGQIKATVESGSSRLARDCAR